MKYSCKKYTSTQYKYKYKRVREICVILGGCRIDSIKYDFSIGSVVFRAVSVFSLAVVIIISFSLVVPLSSKSKSLLSFSELIKWNMAGLMV